MPRTLTRQTVDELLGSYEQAHRELAGELDRLLLEAKGEDVSAKSGWLGNRIAQVEYQIARLRTGRDPVTGEVVFAGPGWQGVVGEDGTNGLAAEIAHQSYSAGLRISDDIMAAQGVEAPTPDFANIHEQAAETIAVELTTDTEAHLAGILRKTEGVFRDIQARATVASITKGEDVRQAATRLVNEYREAGVQTGPKVSYWSERAGRMVEYDMDSGAYARMLARTVASKAAQQADDLRAAEADIDLVQVVGGVGGATCGTCERAFIQGIYSRSGESEEYPPLSEVLEASPPLGHPNCGHKWSPYVEESDATQEELDYLHQKLAEDLGAESLTVEGITEEDVERSKDKVERERRARLVREREARQVEARENRERARRAQEAADEAFGRAT